MEMRLLDRIGWNNYGIPFCGTITVGFHNSLLGFIINFISKGIVEGE